MESDKPAVIVMHRPRWAVRVLIAGVVALWLLVTAMPAQAGSGGVGADGSGMYGVWTSSSNHPLILWYLQSPVAPRGGLYGLIFYSNAEAGQHFDCGSLAVQEGSVSTGHTFQLRSTVTRHAQLSCGDGALAVRVAPVPSGLVARVVIPTEVDNRAISYLARGVISMSGRSDIHLVAPLTAAGSPPAAASAAPTPTATPTPTPSASTPTTSAQPSPVSVPTRRPIDASSRTATHDVGPVGVTVLIVSLAAGVLLIGAGSAALRRRHR